MRWSSGVCLEPQLLTYALSCRFFRFSVVSSSQRHQWRASVRSGLQRKLLCGSFIPSHIMHVGLLSNFSVVSVSNKVAFESLSQHRLWSAVYVEAVCPFQQWVHFCIESVPPNPFYLCSRRYRQRAFMPCDLKNDDDQADDGGREQRDYREVKTAVRAASSPSAVEKLQWHLLVHRRVWPSDYNVFVNVSGGVCVWDWMWECVTNKNLDRMKCDLCRCGRFSSMMQGVTINTTNVMPCLHLVFSRVFWLQFEIQPKTWAQLKYLLYFTILSNIYSTWTKAPCLTRIWIIQLIDCDDVYLIKVKVKAVKSV